MSGGPYDFERVERARDLHSMRETERQTGCRHTGMSTGCCPDCGFNARGEVTP